MTSMPFVGSLISSFDKFSTVSSQPKSQYTSNALHQSVLDGRLKQLVYFLKMGFKPDIKDKYGRTCLMLACLSDHQDYGLQVAKILLKNGADLNETDKLGRTCLYLACSQKREKLFNFILDNYSKNIDFTLKDNDGDVLLNHVAVYGSFSMCKKLLDKMLDKKVSVDFKNCFGYTALLLAIKNDKYSIAFYLVKYGQASVSLKDNEFNLNAIEWLMNRIELNRDKILNKDFNLELEDFELNDSFNINKSLINSKSWYKSSNQYFNNDLRCDHVSSPNLSVEHEKSRFVPHVLANSFDSGSKNIELPRLIKSRSSYGSLSDKSSSLDDLEDGSSLKEIVQRLYELIYKRMFMTHSSTQISLNDLETKSKKNERKASLSSRQRSVSVANIKLNDSIILERTKTPVEFKLDKNIFNLESMRHTPKLIALQPKLNNTKTIKESMHYILNLYDSSYHSQRNNHSRQSSNQSRKQSIDHHDLLPKLSSKSRGILAREREKSIINGFGNSTANHVKFKN